MSIHADLCANIARYDEEKNEIFVVCPLLSSMNDKEIENTVYKVLTSSGFSPKKEYTINFVTSTEYISKEKLDKNNHIGLYYSSNNRFLVWPKIKSKQREIQLRI